MFNNDVTQTYNQQDATLEILVMLAGAFLLGFLLCWLIRKLLVANNKVTVKRRRRSGSIKHRNLTTPQSLTNSNRTKAHVVTKENAFTNYSTPRIDDLTKISGIDTDVEDELRQRGIKSYIDLRDSSKQTIIETLNTNNANQVSPKEAQTWPHQASLAAKGEWEKLKEYQAFMARTQKAAEKIKQQTQQEKTNLTEINNDLKMIEGIGPKIEELLNTNNIHTFRDLRKADRDTLKTYLNSAGSRFKMHEPQSWPHQAGMAERGEWEELKIYQEFMDGGREIPSQSASAKIVVPDQSSIDEVESEYNQALDQANSDDLKKIEGIGPKIEDILNSKGINTFKELYATDRDTLKEYLDHAGNQFKMHEPESWPHQAGMATRGEWKELRIYQEFMSGGRETPSASSQLDDSAPSLHVKNAPDKSSVKKNDDFKKIEGIGPKIQELLNKSKINTYHDLKNTKSSFIKSLLDEAGPQYRMHDPETWPAQAKMAHEGEWEKLEAYQEKLISGR
jgi:predicted flap endonuclease-1-like 5' DNA nuclease